MKKFSPLFDLMFYTLLLKICLFRDGDDDSRDFILTERLENYCDAMGLKYGSAEKFRELALSGRDIFDVVKKYNKVAIKNRGV